MGKMELTVELKDIEPSKADMIRKTFEPMTEMLSTFESKYNDIMTEKESGITKELTAKAKRLRIDISKVRTTTENMRKEQKEEYLRAGKAIDGVANILKWAVTEKEEKLEAIEKHFEKLEYARLEKLQEERVSKLLPYLPDAGFRDMRTMANDIFDAFYEAKKKAFEDAIVAEAKAKADAEAKAKAEEEIRAEAQRKAIAEAEERARLKAEAEAVQAIAKAKKEAEDALIKLEQEKEYARLAKIFQDEKEAEAEARLKAEAEARVKRELERVEREKAKAIAMEKAHKEAVEMARVEAERKAVENQKAKEEAERLAQEKIENNKKHQQKIHLQTKESLMSFGLSEDVAKNLIMAIRKGDIQNVFIKY